MKFWCRQEVVTGDAAANVFQLVRGYNCVAKSSEIPTRYSEASNPAGILFSDTLPSLHALTSKRLVNSSFR